MSKSADAFRTISEVAEWLGVQTHVLRFWESKFTQVKPVKRAGGRRYYRPGDMLLLGGIRKLLHDDGMTIKGVQKILREEGMAYVSDLSGPLDEITAAQVEGDLVAGSGDIEAEMAPNVEPTPQEATVTPLVPPAPPQDDDAPAMASFVRDVPEPPLETAPERPPDPEPEPEIPEPAVEARAEPAPAEDMPPEDATIAPDAVSEAEAPAPEAQEAETSEPGPVPSFMRRSAIEDAPAPADPEPAPEPAPEDTVEAGPPMPEPDPEPAAAPRPETIPSFLAEPSEPEPVPETGEDAPAPLRPQHVEVAPDPDYSSFAAHPSALTHAARLSQLSDGQREMLRPLLAQLTALRDQMASARRDSR